MLWSRASRFSNTSLTTTADDKSPTPNSSRMTTKFSMRMQKPKKSLLALKRPQQKSIAPLEVGLAMEEAEAEAVLRLPFLPFLPLVLSLPAMLLLFLLLRRLVFARVGWGPLRLFQLRPEPPLLPPKTLRLLRRTPLSLFRRLLWEALAILSLGAFPHCLVKRARGLLPVLNWALAV